MSKSMGCANWNKYEGTHGETVGTLIYRCLCRAGPKNPEQEGRNRAQPAGRDDVRLPNDRAPAAPPRHGASGLCATASPRARHEGGGGGRGRGRARASAAGGKGAMERGGPDAPS